ncbi:MAG: DUF255 domain-containing protein [Bacteroidetes bacterium]|nr:MAG: DUF255 domain-containing protein [Bacteroidota bacterium]
MIGNFKIKQMKKVITLCAFVLLSLTSISGIAQSGISFTQESWFKLLERAKTEDKIIFMDAYAVWCGPCKQMSRTTFTDPEVGAFFNKHFINVKMDMEKGEGAQLAKTYQVMAYPTLLFIDSDGKVVHRSVGFQNAKQFLELGKIAADPTRRISALDARYEKGDRSPDFLYEYAQVKYEAMDPVYEEVAKEYLVTQYDWTTEENMKFIFQFTNSSDSKFFDFIIKNRDLFEKQFGRRAVAAKIQNIVSQELSAGEGSEILEKAKTIFAKVYPDKADYMYSQFKISYFGQIDDWENFARAAIDHYDHYKAQSADELNNIAWTFYEKVDNKKQMKCALKWAKEAVEMEDNYYNNDTLAAVWFKLGKKGKARKAALKAIELAKKEGEDYSITQDLLNKINGK